MQEFKVQRCEAGKNKEVINILLLLFITPISKGYCGQCSSQADCFIINIYYLIFCPIHFVCVFRCREAAQSEAPAVASAELQRGFGWRTRETLRWEVHSAAVTSLSVCVEYSCVSGVVGVGGAQGSDPRNPPGRPENYIFRQSWLLKCFIGRRLRSSQIIRPTAHVKASCVCRRRAGQSNIAAGQIHLGVGASAGLLSANGFSLAGKHLACRKIPPQR